MPRSDIIVHLPLFTINSYMGRCLNAASSVGSQQAVGAPEPGLLIADCDGSVRQQFAVEELDAMHHVRLHGAGACIEAASATEGAAVTLHPCSASPMQVFDLDGDSIILDSDWDLVVQLKDSLTPAGTPVVLGRRLTSDVEFWDFISLDSPPRTPTSGFETVSASSCPPPPATLGSCLQNDLQSAQPNTVIQLVPDELITFTDLPQPLAIPGGVTLRGDRRGVLLGPQVQLTQGHASNGEGDDPGLFIMQASRSRITGLRIRGPGRDGDHPFMKGVDMVVATQDNSQPPVRTYFSELVDHNDISDWPSAVDLKGPDGDLMQCPLAAPSGPQAVHVFRNYIHDNPKGYGMVAGSGAYPLVFGNTFQKNLQSLSSDGYARSGYVAVANLFMGGNGSVDVDVHGPNGIAGDTGHDGGISGLAAQVVGNTFLHGDGGGRHANFCLRGLPCSGVTVTFKDNVTVQSVGDSVSLIPPDKIPPVGSSGSDCIPWPEARPRVPYMSVDSKFSIADPMQTFLVGNFDGDTKDDVFMATGAAWYYSPGGNAEWRFLSAKTETTDELLIGDFDGDGRADVFKASGDDWYVSWGGRSDWQLLSTHHRANMTKPDYGTVGFVIGDFVSDNGADVFFADGQTWWLSEAGIGPFQPYATSSCKRPSLVFGKFDQSGKMEPACVVAGQWMYVPSQPPHEWTRLRSTLTQTMNSVVVADFKGDGISDIAFQELATRSKSPPWEISIDGRDDPFPLEFLKNLPSAIAIGHFSDDHPGADILSWQGNYWALTSYYVGSPQRQSRQDMR